MKFGAFCILGLIGFADLVSPAKAQPIHDLRPHRAVYDVKMIQASDRSGISGMNGRIVYEMKGSACEGFAVKFRFLTEVQAGRRTIINDQHTTTFEAGDGSRFNFVSQSYFNQRKERATRGFAVRDDEGLQVSLQQPEDRELRLEEAMFQAQHTAALIEAARAGKTILEAKVYDGSEAGDSFMNTTGFIGSERLEKQAIEQETQSVVALLGNKPVWPVSVSYFSNEAEEQSGERLPAYQVSFLMLEDGVTRDLKMQFEEYSLRASLVDLEYLPMPVCEASN